MSFVKASNRRTKTYFFNDQHARDSAYDILSKELPDVHFNKVMGSSLLCNLTGSTNYDLAVDSKIRGLGGMMA